MKGRLAHALFLAIVVAAVLTVSSRWQSYWAQICWLLPVILLIFWRKKQRPTESLLATLIIITLLGPWISPYDPMSQHPEDVYHLLGQDRLGRDIFTRLLYGNLNTIRIAVSGALLASIAGVVVGGLLAMGRGRVQNFANVVIQAYMSIPLLIHFLMALAFFEPGAKTLIILFGVTLWPELARMLQAEIGNLRRAHFVQVARMQGFEGARLYLKEIVPNLRAVLLVNFVVTLANAIILESILSYLGLGLQLGTPSLGHLIQTGTKAMDDQPQILIGGMFFLAGWLLALRALLRRLGTPGRKLIFKR